CSPRPGYGAAAARRPGATAPETDGHLEQNLAYSLPATTSPVIPPKASCRRRCWQPISGPPAGLGVAQATGASAQPQARAGLGGGLMNHLGLRARLGWQAERVLPVVAAPGGRLLRSRHA